MQATMAYLLTCRICQLPGWTATFLPVAIDFSRSNRICSGVKSPASWGKRRRVTKAAECRSVKYHRTNSAPRGGFSTIQPAGTLNEAPSPHPGKFSLQGRLRRGPRVHRSSLHDRFSQSCALHRLRSRTSLLQTFGRPNHFLQSDNSETHPQALLCSLLRLPQTHSRSRGLSRSKISAMSPCNLLSTAAGAELPEFLLRRTPDHLMQWVLEAYHHPQ